jgi:hypothetical protein
MLNVDDKVKIKDSNLGPAVILAMKTMYRIKHDNGVTGEFVWAEEDLELVKEPVTFEEAMKIIRTNERSLADDIALIFKEIKARGLA